MLPRFRQLSDWLSAANPAVFSAYCIAAAFGTYFCMYAFRKPFTAATFEGVEWWNVSYKTLLISAQVAGYTLSKFIGIKVVSELPSRYRAALVVVLIAVAELALFMFAMTPRPWNMIWLFVNGLPLGMVFGLVLGFLEGRQVTESLTAGLCASFIFASGFVKSVGRSLIQDYQVDQYWMPFVTGLVFVIPLLFFVWMLEQIPPPTQTDEEARTKRTNMNRVQRWDYFRRHAMGLIGLIAIYILLTVVRSIRDDFAVEIWGDLGVDEPSVYAWSEFWVTIGVVIVSGMTMLVRNNRVAFLSSIGLLCAGFVIVLATLLAREQSNLSPMAFMVLLGLGMYIPYVTFHTTVFERMIAAFRETGTLGYLMYLADALGYLGYVAVLVSRNLIESRQSDVHYLGLLVGTSSIAAVASAVIAILLLVHFNRTVPKDMTCSLAYPVPE